jgi:hypothetical protein
MDVVQALAELTELSSQVERAVVLDEAGNVLGSTLPDGSATERLAVAARDLAAAAAELHSGEREVTRVEVELSGGAVFVLREGGRTIGHRAESHCGPRRLRPADVPARNQRGAEAEATPVLEAERRENRMKRLLRMVLLGALFAWAWRYFVAGRNAGERAGISYSDGSSVVLEPGTAGFDRLAGIARGALDR